MNLVSMGVEFTLFPSLNKKAPGADFRGLMVITKEKRHFLVYLWDKFLAAIKVHHSQCVALKKEMLLKSNVRNVNQLRKDNI